MIFPNTGLPSKGDLTTNKPVKILLSPCFLENIDFLLPQTAQLDESNVLHFFIFSTFGLLHSTFFLHIKQ